MIPVSKFSKSFPKCLFQGKHYWSIWYFYEILALCTLLEDIHLQREYSMWASHQAALSPARWFHFIKSLIILLFFYKANWMIPSCFLYSSLTENGQLSGVSRSEHISIISNNFCTFVWALLRGDIQVCWLYRPIEGSRHQGEYILVVIVEVVVVFFSCHLIC